MRHQGGGVDEFGQSLVQGAFVRLAKLPQPETLRRSGQLAAFAVDDVVDDPIGALHDGLDRGDYGDGAAMLLHAVNAIRDGSAVNQRADAVMDQYDRIGGEQPSRLVYTIADGCLPRIPSGDDGCDLGQSVLVDVPFQLIDPIAQAHDDDGIHIGMLLEALEGIDDDGAAVEHQELLGLGFGIHPLASSASENHRDVHAPPFNLRTITLITQIQYEFTRILLDVQHCKHCSLSKRKCSTH